MRLCPVPGPYAHSQVDGTGLLYHKRIGLHTIGDSVINVGGTAIDGILAFVQLFEGGATFPS